MSASGSTSESLELGSGRPLPRPRGGGRRKFVAGASALAVLGAGVGAVWAWQAFMAQGPQPAEALPAGTLAYVAVDFDPAAGQKLAASGFLGKFPSLEKHVGPTNADGLRKEVFDELKSDLGCDLSFADVKPWVGSRFALAFVAQDGPQPVAVLQIADRDRASAGLERLANCAEGTLGYAITGDWAVLAESGKVADAVVRDATDAPLSEDTEFQRLTAEAGDPGVVSLYAAPEAGPAVVAAAEKDPYGGMFLADMAGFDPLSMFMTAAGFAVVDTFGAGGHDYAVATSSERPRAQRAPGVREAVPPPMTRAEIKKLETMSPAEQDRFFQRKFGAPGRASGGSFEGKVVTEEELIEDEFPQPALPADLRAALMDFSGLGGVIRFDDGGVELELVSDRIEGTMGNIVAGTAGDDVLAALPADSAAVFGAGFRDGWGATFVERFAGSAMPFGGEPPADAAATFERQTGLTVADLEALGGESFALVAGAGFDPDAFFEKPTGMKVAARVSGDAERVEAALTKLQAKVSDSDSSLLDWRRAGDDVLVGANAAYLDELAASGDLTGAGSFENAVPDAADAASVFYVNFDAGNWLAAAMDKSHRGDVEPLAAVGYTMRDEGDRERTLLRLTTED